MTPSDSDLHNWSELQSYWSNGNTPKDYYNLISPVYSTLTIQDVENAFTKLDIKFKQFFLSIYNSEMFN